ncbi:MAG: hypothetical protein GY953_37285 [bacterium]|nr:hypothetical protein [bacterium]
MEKQSRPRRTVAIAVAKGVIPGLLLAVLSVILWQVYPRDPRIASVVMLVGSFLLFLHTYRRDWMLRWYTCLLPAVASIGCYLVQTFLLEVDKPLGPMGAGIGVGIVLGFARGYGHKVFHKNGRVYARRTVLVLIVWLISYLLTQSFALFGAAELVAWGLTGGAFTTAIVTMFSIVLFVRYLSNRNRPSPAPAGGPAVALLAVCGMLAGGTSGVAQTGFQAGNAQQLGTWQGPPPIVEDWGVRFGKTVYQARLHPQVLQQIQAAKGRWRADGSCRLSLETWSFEGGRLVVDWDQMTASLDPIKVTANTLKDCEGYTMRTARWDEIRPAVPPLVTHGSGDRLEIRSVVVFGTTWQATQFYKETNNQDTQGPNSSATTNLVHRIHNTFILGSGWSESFGWLRGRGATRLETIQSGGNTGQTYAMPPGSLRFPGIVHSLLEARIKPPGHDDYILYQAVETTGRAPADPRLTTEVRSDRSGWAADSLRGQTRLRGRLVRVVRSPEDDIADGRYEQYRQAAIAVDATDYVGRPPGEAYGSDPKVRISRASSEAELQIDWDKRTASLTPVRVLTSVNRGNLSPGKNPIVEELLELFAPASPGKVQFSPAGVREITGGTLTVSYTAGSSELVPGPAEGQTQKRARGGRTTQNPATMRGKPVRISWQAVPQAGGAMLVRLYARPWAQQPFPGAPNVPACRHSAAHGSQRDPLRNDKTKILRGS